MDDNGRMESGSRRSGATPSVRTADTAAGQRRARRRSGRASPTRTRRRASPRTTAVTRLVVFMGKDGVKPDATAYCFFQYVHLDEGEFGFTANGEQWFAFLFSGRRPKLLTVHGRNLRRICDYISLHRMPWIRLADRDFRPGGRRDDDADHHPLRDFRSEGGITLPSPLRSVQRGRSWPASMRCLTGRLLGDG